MPKIFGVEFAPLKIPFEHRMQTLAITLHMSFFIVFPILVLIFSPFLHTTCTNSTRLLSLDLLVGPSHSGTGRSLVRYAAPPYILALCARLFPDFTREVCKLNSRQQLHLWHSSARHS